MIETLREMMKAIENLDRRIERLEKLFIHITQRK